MEGSKGQCSRDGFEREREMSVVSLQPGDGVTNPRGIQPVSILRRSASHVFQPLRPSSQPDVTASGQSGLPAEGTR